MASTNINIRTEEWVKSASEELFESLGLNMSTAINIFLRQAIRENGIPFMIKADIPNETTLVAMREGEALLADTSTKGYTSMKDLKAALEM